MTDPGTMPTEWWQEIINHFEEEWKEGIRLLRLAFYDSVRSTLGAEFATCPRCSRILVPRRVWDAYALNDRPTAGFAPAGSHDHCHSCYASLSRNGDAAKLRKSPLSEKDLQRLRSAVGFDPNRENSS